MEGRRIDDFDLLIGVTALQNNLTMVTANVKHLERIPDLIIENWMGQENCNLPKTIPFVAIVVMTENDFLQFRVNT